MQMNRDPGRPGFESLWRNFFGVWGLCGVCGGVGGCFCGFLCGVWCVLVGCGVFCGVWCVLVGYGVFSLVAATPSFTSSPLVPPSPFLFTSSRRRHASFTPPSSSRRRRASYSHPSTFRRRHPPLHLLSSGRRRRTPFHLLSSPPACGQRHASFISPRGSSRPGMWEEKKSRICTHRM